MGPHPSLADSPFSVTPSRILPVRILLVRFLHLHCQWTFEIFELKSINTQVDKIIMWNATILVAMKNFARKSTSKKWTNNHKKKKNGLASKRYCRSRGLRIFQLTMEAIVSIYCIGCFINPFYFVSCDDFDFTKRIAYCMLKDKIGKKERNCGSFVNNGGGMGLIK
jgi:hypothetical protein